MLFHDRSDAGRRLARALAGYRGAWDPIVLALPRGGAPVGYEIARALDAPLDVVLAREIPAPGREGISLGAVAPGGIRLVDAKLLELLGLSDGDAARAAALASAELDAWRARARAGRGPPELRGRTVVLAGDGLASAAVLSAAARSIARAAPWQTVLALPLCPTATAALVEPAVDALVCLARPAELGEVRWWYAESEESSEEAVAELVARRARERARGRVDEAAEHEAVERAWTRGAREG